MTQLRIYKVRSAGRVSIDGAPITIGRSSQNTVVLRSTEVSRHHCIIEVADGAVPVYTYDLITVYRSSPSLWGASPDIVMDRDTGVDAIISRAIYEEVQQALFEYARELGEEPIECTVDDCGQPDDHLDTDGGLCTEHCGECDECEEEEE